jgi:hypothetical protein
MQGRRVYIMAEEGVKSLPEPELPNETPIRAHVTAMRVEGGEVWATLSNGTTIHRREVDGVWEDA